MEILMKLKCSPSAPGTPSHSTLKVVDHHHQLQQQHSLGSQMRSSPLSNAHTHVQKMPPCMEYSTTMDCCVGNRNLRHESGEFAAIYDNATAVCCDGGNTYAPPMTCCSGVGFGMTPQLPPPLVPPLSASLMDTHLSMEDFNAPYEYHEPEENFISIEDAKIKGLLMKIGAEKARSEKSAALDLSKPTKTVKPMVYEIIDLDDDDEREKLKQIKNREKTGTTTQPQPADATHTHPKLTTSPDIRLIPKCADIKTEARTPLPTNASKEETIIAQIDLLDSSDSEANDMDVEADNEENSDDEELPLVAAAVSCELECDNDDEEEEAVIDHRDTSSNDVVILASDDENIDFIDEHEEGLELRWDDLEEHKERTFFECYLCGKKVQSSYNLRRHMMIHTGERPFGCDLCVRRFREFSDLKKHRRRHANENNFLCMICRINPPTEHDATRCNGCDTRNGALIAALNPQLSTTPEASQTPPPKTSKKPPSRNLTPAPVSTPPPTTTAAALAPKTTSAPGNTFTGAIPPLTPISNNSDAQLLLDNIPAVHRPAYNHQGVITRREFPCPLCQRPFGTRHNLKRHFMIHTGEKPFSCSKCRKPFREYSTLKKHMVTHRRDRWYKCLRCPKKYRDYLDYMDHKNTHPKEETCSSSSSMSVSSPKKKSKTKYDYDSYCDSNEDDSSCEDWLECCECGQRYTDIDSYTEHLKAHDPSEFQYECYICKETFEERSVLVKHVAEHGDQGSNQDTYEIVKRKKRLERE